MSRFRSSIVDRFKSDESEEPISQATRWARRTMAAAGLAVIMVFIFTGLLVGENDLHSWQVLQYPLSGKVEIRNRPGWYFTWGARVTTYPRMINVYATKTATPESPSDDSVSVQFNDGGKASISWVLRVTTPCPEHVEDEGDQAIIAKQREFHRQFMGNNEAAHSVVRSVLGNLLPQVGPIMSSTENQAARKGEFWQVIHDQLQDGQYKMKPVEVKTDTGMAKMIKAMQGDNVAEQGPAADKNAPVAANKRGLVLDEHSITVSETVVAAEIVRDPATGKPVVVAPPPLEQYGMHVQQFSILETDYDADTLQKFSDKKKLYLQAEQSKAQAIQFVQQRFQRKAQGDREIAEQQWISEQERARKRIQAETTNERQMISKETKRIEEETSVLIADVKKQEQEIFRDIADLKAQMAANDKKAAEIAADARERQIEVAGAISDHEKTLATIDVEQTEKVTKFLEKLQVPDIVIMTAEAFDPSKGTAMQQAMPSMQFLEKFGLLKESQTLTVPPRAKVVPAGVTGDAKTAAATK